MEIKELVKKIRDYKERMYYGANEDLYEEMIEKLLTLIEQQN